MARLAHVHAREAADARGKMLVGVGPVDDPPSGSGGAARSVAESAVKLRKIGIFEADEMKLAVSWKSGRRLVAVLDAAESLRQQHTGAGECDSPAEDLPSSRPHATQV